MITWHVETAHVGSGQLAALLRDEWEPFGAYYVPALGFAVIVLRKKHS